MNNSPRTMYFVLPESFFTGGGIDVLTGNVLPFGARALPRGR
jgi:hypothetical protein